VDANAMDEVAMGAVDTMGMHGFCIVVDVWQL